MKIDFLLIGLFSFIALMSCTKHSGHEEPKLEVIDLTDQLPDDFSVPDVVWKSMKPKMPDDKEKPIIYTMAHISLKEKNKGVLRKPLLKYEFARGGGELDLSRVVGTASGTFYMQVDLPELENALAKKVFFISQSRKRKVEDEILGSGCQKIMDISTQFFKQVKEGGIKINTTRDRHDSIMGGHMIFLGETEKNWFLTQVTFFDSSRMDLFCKGFRSAAVEVH